MENFQLILIGEFCFHTREMIEHLFQVFQAYVFTRKATVSIVARGRRIRIPGRPVVSRSEMSGYITSGGATMSDS